MRSPADPAPMTATSIMDTSLGALEGMGWSIVVYMKRSQSLYSTKKRRHGSRAVQDHLLDGGWRAINAYFS